LTKKKIESSFEAELKRLEEISSILESDEIGLDKAMSLYEEGIKLSKNCLQTLKNAELRITELRNELGKLVDESNPELSDN